MVNQWGRDGTVSSGSAKSSGGGSGLIVAVLVALVIGAGGGYVGARFLSGASSSDIAARDKKIAELNQTLSEMKFDNQGSATQQNQRIKDLEAQVQSLQRARDEKASAADRDAQAEIAALKKTIEEAGDVSAKLNRTQKSLKVSEFQIIELEQTVRDQKSDIAKLKAQLSASTDTADAAARQQIAALRKDNDALQAKIAAISAAGDDAAALKRNLADLKSALADAQSQIAGSQASINKLNAALATKTAALDTASKNAESLRKKSAELQGKLDEMAESLADRDRSVRQAAQDLRQAKADLDTAQAQVQDLRQQKQALGKSRDDLNKQVAALTAAIAELKAAATSSGKDKPSSNDVSRTDPDQTDNGLTPRDRGDVEKAVADLPGYAGLSADKQKTLIDMLERGECVTDSLKAAYGHVSPISLRSLFRDLGGRC